MVDDQFTSYTGMEELGNEVMPRVDCKLLKLARATMGSLWGWKRYQEAIMAGTSSLEESALFINTEA